MSFTPAFPILRQIGQNTFRLQNTITYRDVRGDHQDHATSPHLLTDRASIPGFLWSLIAPFGRQTRAALIHDTQCNAATLGKDLGFDVRNTARRRQREDADGRFFRMLVDDGVPRFRAAVMWSVVSIHRYAVHARPAFVALLVAQILVGFGSLSWGLWRIVAGHDGSAWPLLLVPLVLALPWTRAMWRSGRALVLAQYAGLLVAPFVVVTLVTWIPLGLLNLLFGWKPAPLDAYQLQVTGTKPGTIANVVYPTYR